MMNPVSTCNRRTLLQSLALLATPNLLRAQSAYSLRAAQNWLFLGSGPAFASTFNQSIPGPTLELFPGQTTLIHFTNSLPETTNLHFHGLHVSPEGNSDNFMLHVLPGQTQIYSLALPATHPGGTFWYHPHIHGNSANQVSRGLAGPIVVRGPLDQVPEIAATPEAFFFLQDFAPSASGQFPSPSPMDTRLGREGPLINVNGQSQPTFSIERNGWLRLRIVNASPSRFYRLQLESHTFFVIATDGGALQTPIELDQLLIVPGERYELMIRANRNPGSYTFWNLPYDRGSMGMRTSSQQAIPLATLRYEGTNPNATPLRSHLVHIVPLPAPSIERTFTLSESGMAFTINGRSFDPDRIDTRVQLDSIEDWHFINQTSMDHPIHLHTNFFQLLDPATNSPIRAWKDTTNIPSNTRQTLRIAFRDFPGIMPYHCHILDHEDLGMMATLSITP